jgi:hypothetical protein
VKPRGKLVSGLPQLALQSTRRRVRKCGRST